MNLVQPWWLMSFLIACLMGCAGCNTTTRVGPTPLGYFFWLETFQPAASAQTSADSLATLSVDLELIVSVENGQGAPLDGVLVEFLIDPTWANSASITPRHTLSKAGKARAVFRAFSAGRAPVMARVDTMHQRVMVNVSQDEGGGES